MEFGFYAHTCLYLQQKNLTADDLELNGQFLQSHSQFITYSKRVTKDREIRWQYLLYGIFEILAQRPP